MIKKLAHASFKASDFEKSVSFYRDTLGMKEKFRLTFGDLAKKTNAPVPEAWKSSTWMVYMEAGPGQFIEIFAPTGGEEVLTFDLNHFDHIGYLHICLEVDDIKKAFDRLKEKNANILTEPNLGADGAWQFWITDPDGNAIELMEYTSESLQVQPSEARPYSSSLCS